MIYELLLEDIRKVSKNTVKRIIFELDQEKIEQIKSYKLRPEIERELILMQKDRSFLEMLLVNALMDDDSE